MSGLDLVLTVAALVLFALAALGANGGRPNLQLGWLAAALLTLTLLT